MNPKLFSSEMLKFFRNLFREEEKIEKIEKDELEQWFNSKASELEAKTKARIDFFKKELNEKISLTFETLRALEKTELRNPNITVREIQFMEGNRKTYVQRTELFLNQIKDILDYEFNFFFQNYKQYIEDFSRSTTRSYRILQEFYAHESRDVAIKIKEIDELISNLKNDEQINNYEKIEEIKKGFFSINNKIKKKKEMEDDINDIDNEIIRLKEQEKILDTRKNEILSSQEYKEILNLEIEKRNIENKLNSLKDAIVQRFSSLQRALRKYQRITLEHERLIEYYIADPLSALISDNNFHIVAILEGAAKNISNNIIELKEPQKALQEIRKLNREYFANYLTEYKDFLKKKEQTEKRISENKLKKEHDELKERINEANESNKGLNNKKMALENELASINVANMYTEIKNKIIEILKIKIEL